MAALPLISCEIAIAIGVETDLGKIAAKISLLAPKTEQR